MLIGTPRRHVPFQAGEQDQIRVFLAGSFQGGEVLVACSKLVRIGMVGDGDDVAPVLGSLVHDFRQRDSAI